MGQEREAREQIVLGARHERARSEPKALLVQVRHQAEAPIQDVTPVPRPKRPRDGPIAAGAPSRSLPVARGLRSTLATRAGLRHAILVAEILGSPKALREPDER